MSGGMLLTMNLSMSTTFLIVGLPALVGGASMFIFGRYQADRTAQFAVASGHQRPMGVAT